MTSSKEELKLARDTLIYLLQNLRFLINRKKSKTRTMSEYTIFGYGNQLNRNDTDPSTTEKREDCATAPGSTGEVISLHKGTKPTVWSPCINGNCSSASTSAVSTHAATTNFRIAGKRYYNSKVNLSVELKAELDWWVENLNLTKRRSIISAFPLLIIAFDASLKGWGAFCQGHRTGGS